MLRRFLIANLDQNKTKNKLWQFGNLFNLMKKTNYYLVDCIIYKKNKLCISNQNYTMYV